MFQASKCYISIIVDISSSRIKTLQTICTCKKAWSHPIGVDATTTGTTMATNILQIHSILTKLCSGNQIDTEVICTALLYTCKSTSTYPFPQ